MDLKAVDAAGVFQIYERLYAGYGVDVLSPLNAGHFLEKDFEKLRKYVEGRVLDFVQARTEYAQKLVNGDRLPVAYSQCPPEEIIQLIAMKNAEFILTAVEESYFDAFAEYEKIARAQAQSFRVSLYRDL